MLAEPSPHTIPVRVLMALGVLELVRALVLGVLKLLCACVLVGLGLQLVVAVGALILAFLGAPRAQERVGGYAHKGHVLEEAGTYALACSSSCAGSGQRASARQVPGALGALTSPHTIANVSQLCCSRRRARVADSTVATSVAAIANLRPTARADLRINERALSRTPPRHSEKEERQPSETSSTIS